MKKVVVTGGCGFLGSHICELFHEQGWQVIAYDNLTKFEYTKAGFSDDIRMYNLRYLEGIGIPTIIDDILNYKMLQKIVNHDTDLIIHTAAQPAMTISITDIQLDHDINVQGTLNVLQAAKEQHIPVINCSSIHVYGNDLNKGLIVNDNNDYVGHKEHAISENYPILKGEISPLHASKFAAELYTRTFYDMYKTPTATFRLSGMYGPRQFGGEDHGWVANFVIRNILKQPIKIFGTDMQVRDILYVKDAANAFYQWYQAGCTPGTYNIGGGHLTAVTLREVLDEIYQLTGIHTPEEWLGKRKGDLWWFISNIEKADKTFNWQPKTRYYEGLKELIDWVHQERELFV